jgi:hypothetical protein
MIDPLQMATDYNTYLMTCSSQRKMLYRVQYPAPKIEKKRKMHYYIQLSFFSGSTFFGSES